MCGVVLEVVGGQVEHVDAEDVGDVHEEVEQSAHDERAPRHDAEEAEKRDFHIGFGVLRQVRLQTRNDKRSVRRLRYVVLDVVVLHLSLARLHLRNEACQPGVNHVVVVQCFLFVLLAVVVDVDVIVACCSVCYQMLMQRGDVVIL